MLRQRASIRPCLSGELWQAQRALDGWYIDWSRQVSEAALNELVEFTFVGGGAGAMTRFEMVLHVVNHTSYHRGFVADLFYQVPAVPPVTDLPVFTRRERGLGELHSA